MRVDFIKCHGSGNDFLLVDARAIDRADDDWTAAARALADRRGPVGSDGLLLLTLGDAHHAFGMRMFNSDGSEAETCLNGLRCVARLGFEALGIDRAEVRLRTSSVSARRASDLAPGVTTIATTAGPASLDVTDWPMDIGTRENVQRPIAALPSIRSFTAVAIPNPHLITFAQAVDEAELIAAGEACEAAPPWLPNRANVSFAVVRDDGNLLVSTFERGVGLTNSCGSAMAAATYAACLTERATFGRALTVFNKGGLVSACATADGMVTLAGNATFEWEGSADLDVARGAVGAVTVARRRDDEVASWAAAVAGLRGEPSR